MPTDLLIETFKNLGFTEVTANTISGFVTLILVILISYLGMKISRKFFLKWVKTFIEKSQNKVDNILLIYKIPEKISLLIPVLLVYYLSGYIFSAENIKLLYLIHLVTIIYIIIIMIMIINSILATIAHVYEKIDSSGEAPIKSVLQMIKIIISIVGFIIIVSLLINESPWTLLKAMGAMTAVGMLVFKDPILGLVAGIQLSAQKMLRKGDWIEMPNFGANGDVIDVSLTTVKVQNFDKTVVSIPAYALISNSFQNWRGMIDAGGRRIKRSINLDINSFKFLEKTDLDKLKKIECLANYINGKEKEITGHNIKNKAEQHLINGRRLTNIGTYRFYIKQYLLNHVKIQKNMTFIVRQLQATEKGLPLEIYVFANDTDWVNYEEIQSDIFDHLLTVIPEFGLSVFQNPSGKDFRGFFNE